MKIGLADLLFIKCLLLICSYLAMGKEDILKYDHKHRTHKAVEKANGLWCHKCQTMDVNEEFCMNVTRNDSSLHHKCEGDMRTCMVKRFSFSTASSNSSASAPKIWALERNCTQKCEEGCLIIGERNKILVCSTCCENSFCNIGNGDSVDFKLTYHIIYVMYIFILTWQSQYS